MGAGIVHATTDEQLDDVRELLAEYGEFIVSHWPQADREAYAAELRELRGTYPLILLAIVDGHAAGCVMLRDAGEPGVCEVRRLYVRSEYRRGGLARRLMLRLMREVRDTGCRRMRLVAVIRFTGAIPLYEGLGFRRVEPYRPSTMPLDTVWFMERSLEELPA